MTDVSADTGTVSEGGADGAVDAAGAGADGAGDGGGDSGDRLFSAFQQFQQQQEQRWGELEQRLPQQQEEESFEEEPFDAAPYFDDSRFSDDDFTDDGALSPEAQMRALADMQRAIVREELAPVLEAREQERRDREATALEQRYPELADEQTAVRYVQEGVQAAEALGNPALAREPAFLEMVYLAAKARERAGQEIPAGSAPGVTLETGPGGSPASSESGDDVADRIVAAGGRKPFRIGG